MPSLHDFPAQGVWVGLTPGQAIFAPAGSNYQLQLSMLGTPHVPAGTPCQAIIRLAARKVLTVPSGGNYIEPIVGPPRIIQGRILALDQRQMVVQAGVPVVVDLPEAESGYDLPCGPLAVGVMVNVAALPGASLSVMVNVAALPGASLSVVAHAAAVAR